MRHHVEAVGNLPAFSSGSRPAVFRGNGGFDHQRLYQRVRSGVIKDGCGYGIRCLSAVLQPVSSVVRGQSRYSRGAHDAAECDFLPGIYPYRDLGDVFIDSVGQVAARLFQAFGVNPGAFGVQQPALRAREQARRGGGFFAGSDLRVPHKDAVEVDIDGGNTVSRTLHIRTHFDDGDAVCLFQAEARVRRQRGATPIPGPDKSGRDCGFDPVRVRAAPLPRAVQVFARNAPQGVALFDRVAFRRVQAHLKFAAKVCVEDTIPAAQSRVIIRRYITVPLI